MVGDGNGAVPDRSPLPTPGNNGPIIEPEAFGPGFLNADLGIYKDFKFTESKRLQLRAQGFNFMNHPNYSFGNDNNLNLVFDAAGKQTNTLFGTTTSKLGHRVVRLEAKFYF
jgi:hypothetical protein